MIAILLAMASSVHTAAHDQVAVERMIRGDQGGLAELYDRHGRFVFSLALRILRDRGDAEDVTQEVFVQAWKQADRFDTARGNVVAWLVTMARARSIDFLRRRRVRPALAPVDTRLEAVDEGPGQDLQLEWGQRADAIQEAMRSLPLLQRLAIELAFFEGLTHAEIAAQLEVPLGTVKTRVRQGLLKLRDTLAGVEATS
ncbi:MAG TPA: sigma-70 family RNA polymerase sigma factor [Vicinamibacterales bacterium]|nr:sigma-70 family RNA polymerase sigma factor [Vicinamibacterales bacterium]